MNNKNLTYPRYFLFTLILVTLFSSHLPTASAQEPEGPTEPPPEEVSCGSIVAPAEWESDLWLENPIESVPITDCALPFGDINEWEPGERKMKFTIAGSLVEDGGIFIFTDGRTKDYDFEYNFLSDYSTYGHVIFRHQDNDYEFVDGRSVPLTETDYRELAIEFGVSEELVGEYVSRQTSDDPYEGLVYGTPEYQSFDEYDSFVYIEAQKNYPYLETGTYTIVYHLYERESAWDEAYLASRHADTFTITGEEIEPLGASSVLFLPGIMGSRLYEESDACGIGVKERERWSSFSICDQLRLKTNYLGQSLNNIYTYAAESAVLDEMNVAFGAGPNIYKSFLEDLNEWKNDDKISDYLVVPYDWRLRLDDLVKMKRDPVTNKITIDSSIEAQDSYLYEALSRLSQNSQSGKVTVVAHSNGGLLIKYFLQTLDINDPLLKKIDNIILVAVPQEGTPESLIGVLYGVELGVGGIVMNRQTSRTLIKDAPFGFQLLPTQRYFDSVITPVIMIESGLSTDEWKNQFGEILNSYDLMRNFLVKESGREVPSDEDVLQPSVIDSYAFDYKNLLAEVFYNWEAPEGVRVYQVAGTGVNTPSGLTYFTDVACVERDWFTCDRYEKKPGYRINSVLDGDGTVVTPSALSMSKTDEVERWWVDLFEYGDDVKARIHRDILEVQDVRDFIYEIAASSSASTFTYLKDTPPASVEGERLIFQLHSPLDMYAVLSDGSVVGSSTEVVRGAYYRRFGEVQQLSIPAAETNYILYLSGQSSGSFSLDVEKYTGSSLNERHTYSAVPSSTSTKVEFPVESIDEVNSSTSLAVDYDGNGTVDVQVSIWSDPESDDDGSQIATSTPEVNTDTKSKSSSGTKVGFKKVNPTPLVAGVTISIDSTQADLLQQIIILLQQYRDLLIIINNQSL